MKTLRRICTALLALAGCSTPLRAGNGQWTLTGWNNLGMHCMDDDYSVFSILPPFNTVNAQLMDQNGRLVTNPAAAGIILTYQAAPDADGSINCTAAGKTNFWEFAPATYGVNLPIDKGLGGTSMPGPANTPQQLTWDERMKWFEALGIPVTPVDDAGHANPYPLMRITARNAAGALLAKTDVVLPVSAEMNCRACHASGTGPQAQPAAGWVNDPNPKRDHRLNILRLHDERHAASQLYQTALAANGYSAEGLYDSAVNHANPALCAKCHASEALGTGGYPGVAPLTRSMHARHATALNPEDSLPLGSSQSRNSCYQCHPGSATRCLRGAMGSSISADGTMAMQCQSCHGGMNDVGSATRTGWLHEPTCQSCHTGDALSNSGLIRYTDSFDAPGHMRQPQNTRFATNADTPAPGISLYRFSKGHGGLQCSACHGSTHAEFPSVHRNDNLASMAAQGHTGVLAECTACHASMPSTVTGGPHGMHPTGNAWAKDHADSARAVGLAECQKCHGTNYRGTVLSRAFGNRSLTTKFGTLNLQRGVEVGCYECHNGVSSSNATSRQRPAVAPLARRVSATLPTTLALPAGGTAPVVRVVQQPLHGSVAITGTSAKYFPEPGYLGPDFFTWTASDSLSYRESLPAVVSLSVGDPSPEQDSDADGLSDLVEYALGLDAAMPSSESWPKLSSETVSGAHYQALAYPVSPLRPPDVTAWLEVSGDLSTWNAAIPMAPPEGQLKARDNVNSDSAPHRFIRLHIDRPAP